MSGVIWGEDGSTRSMEGGTCCIRMFLLTTMPSHFIYHDFQQFNKNIHDIIKIYAFMIAILRFESYLLPLL